MASKAAILITLPFQREPYDHTQPWHRIAVSLSQHYQVVVAKDIRFPMISATVPSRAMVLQEGEIHACDSTQRWGQGISYILDNCPDIVRIVHVAGDLREDVDANELVSALLLSEAEMVVGDYVLPQRPLDSKAVLGDYAKAVFEALFGELIDEYETTHSVPVSSISQVRSEYFSYHRGWLEQRNAQWELRWLPWAALKTACTHG